MEGLLCGFKNQGIRSSGFLRGFNKPFSQVSDVCITTWVFQCANSTKVPFGLN
jgi:hypothetical protein